MRRPSNVERTLVDSYKWDQISIQELWTKLGPRAWVVCAWYSLPVPQFILREEKKRGPDDWWVEYWK